jgi:hypothetical protein
MVCAGDALLLLLPEKKKNCTTDRAFRFRSSEDNATDFMMNIFQSSSLPFFGFVFLWQRGGGGLVFVVVFSLPVSQVEVVDANRSGRCFSHRRDGYTVFFHIFNCCSVTGERLLLRFAAPGMTLMLFLHEIFCCCCSAYRSCGAAAGFWFIQYGKGVGIQASSRWE